VKSSLSKVDSTIDPGMYFILFLFALTLRLVCLYALYYIDPTPLQTDMWTYYHNGLRILNGTWPNSDPFYEHPFMSFFVAISLRLFGLESSLAPRLLNCLVSAICCPLLAYLTYTAAGVRAGLISGIALAVFQASIYYSTVILDVPFTTLVILVLFFAMRRWTTPQSTVAGLFIGLGLLARGHLLLCALVAVAYGLSRRRFISTTIFTCVVILVLSPVLLKHYQHGKMVITASAPRVLWIGNRPGAPGWYNYEPPTPVPPALSDYWVNDVRDFMFSSTREWLKITGRKGLMYFTAYDGKFSEEANLVFGGTGAYPLLKILPSSRFFMLVGLLWLAFRLRKPVDDFVYSSALMFGAYSLGVILLVIELRYRVPIMVFPIMWTSVGVASVLDRLGFNERSDCREAYPSI